MKIKNYFDLKGILTLIMSMFAFTVFAQNITVSGTVVDDTGMPVIGATVVIVETPTRGTVTDIDGNYTLKDVPPDATLRFSFVGLKPRLFQLTVELKLMLFWLKTRKFWKK